MGERMRLRQSQLRECVLGGIALSWYRLLILQHIAEIGLHRARAIGRQFTAHGLGRAAIDDAEQADGAADKRKVLRSDALETMTPRPFVRLRIRKRAVEIGR